MKCPHCDGTGELLDLSFGALVLAKRKEIGATQQDIAMKAGMSRTQLANIEIGRSDVPLKTLQRIASALGCSAKELVP